MSTLKVIHEISLFDDEEDSNDLDQVRIKYRLTQEEVLSSDFRIDSTFANGASTAVNLPALTYNWLYVLTNQTINVRLNGLSTNEFEVSPSVAGTKDGLMIKRGDFTSLSINVPGATDADVFILAGVVDA